MRTKNKVRSRKEVKGLRVALGVEKEKIDRRIYMEKWSVKVKNVKYVIPDGTKLLFEAGVKSFTKALISSFLF